MSRINASFIAVILLGILYSHLALCRESITIAVGDWPPYLSSHEKNKGIVAGIITEIFSAAGYDVKYKFLPWARAYDQTKRGDFDCTGVWLKKSERQADFYYSDPVLKEKHVFFHRIDVPFHWRSMNDLKGMKIGGIQRFSYGSEFDRAEKLNLFKVDRAKSDLLNFRKLLAKRFQIYPQEINVGYSSLMSDFKPEERALITNNPKVLFTEDSYLLCPKKLPRSKTLVSIFNKGLEKIREGGRYANYIEYDIHKDDDGPIVVK
jgi:polar amino acid transport system substrate-binding protein